MADRMKPETIESLKNGHHVTVLDPGESIEAWGGDWNTPSFWQRGEIPHFRYTFHPERDERRPEVYRQGYVWLVEEAKDDGRWDATGWADIDWLRRRLHDPWLFTDYQKARAKAIELLYSKYYEHQQEMVRLTRFITAFGGEIEKEIAVAEIDPTEPKSFPEIRRA